MTFGTPRVCLRVTAGTLLFLGLWLAPERAIGQSGEPGGAEAEAGRTPESATQLDEQAVDAEPLRRELFRYPSAGRRDPFRPLDPTDQIGPRFNDLELSGILYSETLGSIAILVDRTTLKRYRVWEGESIGGARLVRVRPTDADFVVSVYGVVRRETLTVKREQEEP